MSAQAEEKLKDKKALEIKHDWEAFQKALALALILIGAFLSLLYGRSGKVYKSYRE